MQRDAYAALIKRKGKEIIPLRILQVSGEVFSESIFDDVFDGYKARKLVLMSHMQLSDASKGPVLPRDVVVENFSQLKAIHKPHFCYKLLPLLCENVSALRAINAISSSPGSPFSVAHRRDPRLYRWTGAPGAPTFLDAWEVLRSEVPPQMFSAPLSARRLPIPRGGISFDAVLFSGKESCRVGPGGFAATVNLYDGRDYGSGAALTEHAIREYSCMYKLFRAPPLQLVFQAERRDIFEARNWFHVLAVQFKIPPAQKPLVKLAAERDIVVYECAGDGEFTYVAPV